MELCDFSNVMKIIREYISDARAHSQTNAAPDVQKESIHTYTHQNREFWTNKKLRKAHEY